MSELASTIGRRRKLRNRPVEFVKAKEVYDPNVILYKLAKQNQDEDIDIGVQSISLEDSDDEEEEVENRQTVDDVIKEIQEMPDSEDEGEWDEEELDNEITSKFAALENAMNEISEETDDEDESEEEYDAEDDEPEDEVEEEQEEKVEEEEEVVEEEQDIQPLDIIIDLPSTKVESHKPKPKPQKQEEQSIPEEPEYGFSEEDYEFDVSKIEVTNVRFGISNQYYIKCHELTNSLDFEWFDEQEIIEYVLDNGVKEHRLNKFLSFITNGMIDHSESEPEPEIYISEDDEEDDDESDENEEFDSEQDDYESDDNLDDLIAYSKTSTQGLIPFEDRDFSRNTPAKKRSNFRDLDIDEDLQDSLTRQLQNYRANKKQKKQDWEQQRLEESILRNDMLIKYPESLHIKDIKKEFDLLLKDETRQSMSFPTLDTHAHKTIKKMADCYHMTVHKSGKQGVRKYLKIVKNKGTFKYFPNYEGIERIMRGRPIFHRIDRKVSHDKKLKNSTRGSTSKARLKEGDIVGAEAPEIGESNLGRQMLEKLGWIQGQGLGVDGNKGINEPIVAKVKMSKTGIK
ncbi:SQS1 Protein SQS1 [Candida maltosa Xu316]